MADVRKPAAPAPLASTATIMDNPKQPIVYANMCGVQFGPEDVLLQFAIRDIADPSTGHAVGKFYSNLSNMKRLISVLNNSLKEYEEMFGEIPIDVVSERITPEGKRRLREIQEQSEK